MRRGEPLPSWRLCGQVQHLLEPKSEASPLGHPELVDPGDCLSLSQWDLVTGCKEAVWSQLWVAPCEWGLIKILLCWYSPIVA